MVNFHIPSAIASALLAGTVAFLFGTGLFLVARAYLTPEGRPVSPPRDALPPEVARPLHRRGDRKGRRGPSSPIR